MSLILKQEVASALYRSLMEVNNVSASHFEITLRTKVNELIMPVTFKYIEGYGVSIMALSDKEDVRNMVESYRTQHDFAVAYGFAS